MYTEEIFKGEFYHNPNNNITILLNSEWNTIPYIYYSYGLFNGTTYSSTELKYLYSWSNYVVEGISLGPLYNFTMVIDYFAWFTPINKGARISVGVAQYVPPPTPQPITYTVYLNATDQYNNFVSTNIYINGTRYSTGTSIDLLNATYIISADIPENYRFVRWSSRYGNITFANQYNLTTSIRVWGNDVLTLTLSYSPPAPPTKYRVYCYIYDTYNQPVEDAFLIIGDRGCPHEAYLDLDTGTYSLDVSFDTSKYSFNRYSYSGNIYISNIYSKTTSVTINGNGTITAYLNKITTVPPAPPPGGNITLPSAPFINYFGFDKLLILVLILVVGGILAAENIIVGAAFILSGLILTFLGIDAIAAVIILFSFIVSYVIIRIIRR